MKPGTRDGVHLAERPETEMRLKKKKKTNRK